MEIDEKSRIMMLDDFCTPGFSKNLAFVIVNWWLPNRKKLRHWSILSWSGGILVSRTNFLQFVHLGKSCSGHHGFLLSFMSPGFGRRLTHLLPTMLLIAKPGGKIWISEKKIFCGYCFSRFQSVLNQQKKLDLRTNLLRRQFLKIPVCFESTNLTI